MKGGLWFFASQELEYLFFCHTKREFFSQNLTLGYMTKTLNQIFFFSSTKIRILFSATLGIRIFFLENNITSPLQVKWSFPNSQLEINRKSIHEINNANQNVMSTDDFLCSQHNKHFNNNCNHEDPSSI